MRNRVIIQARRDFTMSRQIMLIGGVEKPSGGYSAFQPVSVSDVEPGAFVPPFLEIDHEAAQVLFDELYRIGLRPSDEQALPEKARDEHIADLRRVAFTLLDTTTNTLRNSQKR